MSLHPEFKSILDVIAPDRTRYAGMSDDQLANERAAQEKLASAVEQMWRAIHAVNIGSAIVKIDVNAFSDFIHDELPSEIYWSEKISEARS